MLGMDN